MILVMLALAGTPDPALLRQEGVVAEAASAVARARADGERAARIAELMKAYRAEAERLAALQDAQGTSSENEARTAALRTLADATARGTEARPARAALDAWLGPLDARLTLLTEALTTASGSTPEIRRSIAADVETQAVAVMVSAAYDASRSEATARGARTRAAALKAAQNPMERGGLDVEVDLRALSFTADVADANAAALHHLLDRATSLRDQAHQLSETG